jgi:hypothetical protein
MEMFAPQWTHDLLRHRKHCLGIFGWRFLSGCSPYCSSSRPKGLLGFETRRENLHRFAPVADRSISLTLLSSAGDLQFRDRQA